MPKDLAPFWKQIFDIKLQCYRWNIPNGGVALGSNDLTCMTPNTEVNQFIKQYSMISSIKRLPEINDQISIAVISKFLLLVLTNLLTGPVKWSVFIRSVTSVKATFVSNRVRHLHKSCTLSGVVVSTNQNKIWQWSCHQWNDSSSTRVSEWVKTWVKIYMNGGVSQWVSQWVSENVSEWVKMWVDM